MRRAILLSSLLTLILVGCKPGQEQVRFPIRPKNYQTVASLSPGATEILGSMAYSMKLVGRTAACNFPPSSASAPVVAQVKPDYEKLKAGNPGLVVYDRDLYSDTDIAQIKALGIDTFEFKAKTVDEFCTEIRDFGALSGSEMDASSYVDKIVAERKASMSAALSPLPKVAVMMAGKGGEHYIAGVSSFQADLIRSSGGEPVGPDSDKFVPIDAESLMKLNPEMIVTAGKPDSLVNDPRLKSLTAVAKLKARGIPQDFMTRRGFRIDKAINMSHRAIMDMAGTK